MTLDHCFLPLPLVAEMRHAKVGVGFCRCAALPPPAGSERRTGSAPRTPAPEDISVGVIDKNNDCICIYCASLSRISGGAPAWTRTGEEKDPSAVIDIADSQLWAAGVVLERPFNIPPFRFPQSTGGFADINAGGASQWEEKMEEAYKIQLLGALPAPLMSGLPWFEDLLTWKSIADKPGQKQIFGIKPRSRVKDLLSRALLRLCTPLGEGCHDRKIAKAFSSQNRLLIVPDHNCGGEVKLAQTITSSVPERR
ncbi:hypothetical protein BZA05DRAFT_416228 [Tricharina praecox]|uniref:uncharacterized protein n=1 Tax=Tricharina praecox TaxID=43433 RepID=UPI0022206544|nr:uncharacterized protein BZA05DRAFT_416228 [Tricharina praecox]KAI5856573.1 hypothetical protein BZA05DRAFT_416228 [Tricharina praecox]